MRKMKLWVLLALVAQVAIVLYLYAPDRGAVAEYKDLCQREATLYEILARRQERLLARVQAQAVAEASDVKMVREKIAEFRRKAELKRKAARLDWRAMAEFERRDWDEASPPYASDLRRASTAGRGLAVRGLTMPVSSQTVIGR